MSGVTLWLLAALLVPLLVWLWVRGAPARARLARCGEQIPGPKPLPLIGNSLDLGLDMSGVIDRAVKLKKEYGSLIRLWAGPILIVLLMDPFDVEVLLSSMKHIKKLYTYNFLHSWLGQGLLTSFGDRWLKHRKIITPAFHFRILEQYVEVFNKQGDILISKLNETVDKEYVDISSYVDIYTQVVICETAMGVELNAERSGRASEYLKALKGSCEAVSVRSVKPWYFPETIFKLSSHGRNFKRNVKTLHAMTTEVIEHRKHLLQAYLADKNNDLTNVIGKKKWPFLDLLLLSAKGGEVLSDTDIREEVDTFMFEGQDTTASAISFALYELSRHPDIQDQIYKELKEVARNDNICLSMDELNGLKYLEQVIKETLRMYPSVPSYGREMTEDLKLVSKNVVIPRGVWVVVNPFLMHRDARYFPNPDVFNPDNFSLEAVQKRPSFAYVPFSAGPRNCIGQKFAMLEMKSVLSKIIWNYQLKIDPNFKMKVQPGIVLKWVKCIPISFTHRTK